MLIDVQEFKELCLYGVKNNTKINDFINILFNPEEDLNSDVNSTSILVDYICGGIKFENFKEKSMTINDYFRHSVTLLFISC